MGRTCATAKSRYRSVIDPKLCYGCGLCVSRCNFGSMKMVDSRAVVDEEKCFGCGLYASKCPTDAVKLIQVRHPKHIPVREAEPTFSSVDA